MPVYVDDMEAPFGKLIMCHMIADTHEELIAMADRIGVARKWIQSPGNYGEHFDICKSKRTLAVRYGAKEITLRECGMRCGARRTDEGKAAYFSPAPKQPEPARLPL